MEAPTVWTPAEIQILASTTASDYHLNVSHFIRTFKKESAGFVDVHIQSQYPDKSGPNGKENSWGVCQIDLDYHPEITKAEATDPVFCLDWSAQQWSAGHAASWSAWREFSREGWAADL